MLLTYIARQRETNAEAMHGQPDIRLLLADVDGTVVPKDKVPTEATKAATLPCVSSQISGPVVS